ncbi:hypothetical protein VTI74DRAFT_8051 [Chaetomium olivicolor]
MGRCKRKSLDSAPTAGSGRHSFRRRSTSEAGTTIDQPRGLDFQVKGKGSGCSDSRAPRVIIVHDPSVMEVSEHSVAFHPSSCRSRSNFLAGLLLTRNGVCEHPRSGKAWV